MRIAVASLKGGTTRTTTAIYLAALTAYRAKTTVILLDADPQGSATEWLKETPLPGVTLARARSEVTLNRFVASEPDATIIIDTPSSSERIVRAALNVAHVAVIPTRVGTLEVSRVRATLALVPHSIRAGLTITGPRHTRDLTDSIAAWREAKVPVWATIPQLSGVAAGPTAPLVPDVLDAYRPALTAARRAAR